MAGTLYRLAIFLPSRTQILSPVGDLRPLTIFTPTCFSFLSATSATATVFQHRQRSAGFVVHAVVTEKEEPKWWERSAGPNMIDIHSTKEFLEALSQSGDKLVVVEFYGTWCGSCRALFPKLCKTAEEHPDILFLKVDFDKNKPMCKRLSVRVLPFFHFYRGAEGRLESFSCSLAKDLAIFDPILRCDPIRSNLEKITFRISILTTLFQRIKDAIGTHNTARGSIGPPAGIGDLDFSDVLSLPEKPSEISTSSQLGKQIA